MTKNIKKYFLKIKIKKLKNYNKIKKKVINNLFCLNFNLKVLKHNNNKF